MCKTSCTRYSGKEKNSKPTSSSSSNDNIEATEPEIGVGDDVNHGNNGNPSSGESKFPTNPAVHLKTNPKQQETNDAHWEKSKTVCSFYERGICKHGVRGDGCNFAHPKMCKKILNPGHRKARDCTKTECLDPHPPLCKTSLVNGTCFKKACKKRHVSNTVFDKPKKEKKPSTDRPKNKAVDNNDNVNNHDADKSFLEVMLQQFKEEIAKEIESKIQSSMKALQFPMNQWNWQNQQRQFPIPMPTATFPMGWKC